VLLGGQFEDQDGHAFVVITDSLRAEHYEATKGSFKFTHETWSDITRKRDQFPEGTQIVGWYHTHPGWGVFLSGMDTFICDHFFNKPLDVALVIDPCQSERAFFQWGRQSPRQTRATRGFYLTGSRFRLPELEFYAAQLEGKTVMPNDPRYSGLPGAYPAPVVNIAEARQTWLSVAVLGMLMMQFLVLALIAWALIAWRMVGPAEVAQASPTQTEAYELAEQRKLLDQVIGKLNIAPDGVVQTLEEQRQTNEELRSTTRGQNTLIRELENSQAKAARDQEALQKRTAELLAMIDRLKEDRAAARAKISELKDQLKVHEEQEDEAGAEGIVWEWVKTWKWYLTGGAIVLLGVVAWLFTIYAPRPDDEDREPDRGTDEVSGQ
jgi:proteasome lid subunit RPN8/RPN11